MDPVEKEQRAIVRMLKLEATRFYLTSGACFAVGKTQEMQAAVGTSKTLSRMAEVVEVRIAKRAKGKSRKGRR